MNRLIACLTVMGCVACATDLPEVQRPVLGQQIADLALVDLEGSPMALSDFAGSPVLLNLWATWCPPCRAETPFLQSLHAAHQDQGLRVVGVTVDSEIARQAVDEFLAEAGVEYAQMLDPGMISMDTYGVIGLPATFLLDREGIVRFARLGPVSESDPVFESALEEILQ